MFPDMAHRDLLPTNGRIREMVRVFFLIKIVLSLLGVEPRHSLCRVLHEHLVTTCLLPLISCWFTSIILGNVWARLSLTFHLFTSAPHPQMRQAKPICPDATPFGRPPGTGNAVSGFAGRSGPTNCPTPNTNANPGDTGAPLTPYLSLTFPETAPRTKGRPFRRTNNAAPPRGTVDGVLNSCRTSRNLSTARTRHDILSYPFRV